MGSLRPLQYCSLDFGIRLYQTMRRFTPNKNNGSKVEAETPKENAGDRGLRVLCAPVHRRAI